MGDRGSQGRDRSKKRFRSDGTSVWTRPAIDGPGIWVTCVKGKERQAIGENYDLFESIAEELWPAGDDIAGLRLRQSVNKDKSVLAEDDVEKQIASEMESVKRPRKEKWFSSCHTETPCLLFISCKPPVDPIKLITHHMRSVASTGVPRTRASHRYVPVSGSCDTNLAEITSLCNRIVVPVFPQELNEGNDGAESSVSESLSYKIELRSRNHNTVSRNDVIKAVAACIPARHKVDLCNPDLFILIEIFKSTCGMSVVRDYYRYKKFNVVELAQSRMLEDGGSG